MSDRQYVIGYSNLTEKLSFAARVRASVEAAASQYDNLRLVVCDNDQDNDKALANTEEFAAIPVDIALIYHIDERFGPRLVQVLKNKRIPVISVEVAIPLTTFFGIDNQQAGLQSGEALGRWIQAHWDGQVDKVLILADYRLTGMVRRRLDFALKGLAKTLDRALAEPFYIHSGNLREISAENALPVLQAWGSEARIAVIGQNDDTTLGALDAAKELGMEANIAGVGYGATEVALEELRKPGSSLVASIDMHPEKYGEPLLEVAMRMLRGESVPSENLIHPKCITQESLVG